MGIFLDVSETLPLPEGFPVVLTFIHLFRKLLPKVLRERTPKENTPAFLKMQVKWFFWKVTNQEWKKNVHSFQPMLESTSLCSKMFLYPGCIRHRQDDILFLVAL